MYTQSDAAGSQKGLQRLFGGTGGRAGHSCDEISRHLLKQVYYSGRFICVLPQNYLLQNSPVRGYRQGCHHGINNGYGVLPAGLNFETMPVALRIHRHESKRDGDDVSGVYHPQPAVQLFLALPLTVLFWGTMIRSFFSKGFTGLLLHRRA